MKYAEAIRMREENLRKLLDKPFDKNHPGWLIKDVIISNKMDVSNIYKKMYKDKMSNDLALDSFKIKPDEYEVYVISHQWPSGSVDLLFEEVNDYLMAKSF